MPTDELLHLYFQDEARFGRMDNPAYCWAPKGVRPAVKSQRVRESTYVYGCVCPQDGDLFSMILPYADTDRMEYFMEEFAKHLDGKPTLLVVDGAAWHKGDRIRLKHKNIYVEYLPPYSPELNPTEHLWKHLRQNYLKNRYWESMDELEDSLEEALYDCLQTPEIVRSMTAFDWIKGL